MMSLSKIKVGDLCVVNDYVGEITYTQNDTVFVRLQIGQVFDGNRISIIKNKFEPCQELEVRAFNVKQITIVENMENKPSPMYVDYNYSVAINVTHLCIERFEIPNYLQSKFWQVRFIEKHDKVIFYPVIMARLGREGEEVLEPSIVSNPKWVVTKDGFYHEKLWKLIDPFGNEFFIKEIPDTNFKSIESIANLGNKFGI